MTQLLRLACLLLAFIASAPFASAGEAERSAPPSIAFDLPAQPLAIALERLMAMTGIAVMADSELAAGRRSAALAGLFTPDGALRALLAGTGLEAEPIEGGAYTLVPMLPDVQRRQLPRFATYAAAIQQAVTSALCRSEDTRAMRYRIVMRLWLSLAGKAVRVELASSTGNAALDAAIADALKLVDAGTPVPVGLSQPVKLAVLPRPEGEDACHVGDPVAARRLDAER